MDATEGETSAVPSATGPEEATPGAVQPGDTELAAIVRSVDLGQVDVARLTVMVGGTVISGELVSGAHWWESTGQQARGTGDDAASEQFAKGADIVSQLYRRTDAMEHRLIEYVHLQDAVTDGKGLAGWRIRIEEIEAWRWGP
jgi:hypothetical protein